MIAGKGVPLLGEEGWLRHQEDAAKPPYEGADGVVSPGQRYNVNIYHNDHPVCAASEASRLFLTGAATPPVPGGEHPVLAIHSQLHRPPLQLLVLFVKRIEPVVRFGLHEPATHARNIGNSNWSKNLCHPPVGFYEIAMAEVAQL